MTFDCPRCEQRTLNESSHGECPRRSSSPLPHRTINWTHGCIAVTNDEIEEIAQAVPDGTPVLIERR